MFGSFEGDLDSGGSYYLESIYKSLRLLYATVLTMPQHVEDVKFRVEIFKSCSEVLWFSSSSLLRSADCTVVVAIWLLASKSGFCSFFGSS